MSNPKSPNEAPPSGPQDNHEHHDLNEHQGLHQIHADHAPHTAPAEPHPIKKNVWQRWMAWSGSFFVLSLLLHIILIGGATLLVVEVVQSRKEKMKFTAPPPSPVAPAEHKVKPSKKAAAAPALSKRITTTAANVSIAVPAMEMNATGTDVMASVMSGLGASGLGNGVGGGGSGMASMPLAGLTAFGFKGSGAGGLVGHIFDLKQTKDHQPTEIKDDGLFKDPHFADDKDNPDRWFALFRQCQDDPSKNKNLADGVLNEAKVINDFLSKGWDRSILEKFYESPDPVTTYEFCILNAGQKAALKAFGVDNQMKMNHLLIHYRGKVTGPRDGTFRFIVYMGNGSLGIRFGEEVVFGSFKGLISRSSFKQATPDKTPIYPGWGASVGPWFNVQAGRKYPMDVLMVVGGERPGDGGFDCIVLMEEKDPPTPYLPSEFQWFTKQGLQYQTPTSPWHDKIWYRYPLFVMKQGLPQPPAFEMPSSSMPNYPSTPHGAELVSRWKNFGPPPKVPDFAPEPLVFPGAK